ncbi:PREDICTED: uncharacterized protein LOC108363302 [Rhagoletis zephyria]|uniref:uncharacterized protein LOC108363302 n=1 Tax=Rhagoletis zephyria TaxID=28612 RepID=UPI00081136C4|nr:PREDICTED: uncharacterized protein LOC108363302 [Rhagoletis zephyria]
MKSKSGRCYLLGHGQIDQIVFEEVLEGPTTMAITTKVSGIILAIQIGTIMAITQGTIVKIITIEVTTLTMDKITTEIAQAIVQQATEIALLVRILETLLIFDF